MLNKKIPKEIKNIAAVLAKNGYSAYLVGGCVRDILRGIVPKDYDIATDARPEETLKLFSDSKYENEFGTVLVKTDSTDDALKVVEVTTFRIEGKYSDYRHPEEVKFAKTIEEDLSRRDFTVNAMAMDTEGGVIDPHGGEADLKKKVIRAVGEPDTRFNEDALRLMRAVRFSTELSAEGGPASGWEIEKKTLEAVERRAKLLAEIAEERVREELVKMLMTPRAADGIFLLEKTGLLEYVIPELREGIGCAQNKHHVYEVFEHNVRALEYAAQSGYPFEVRLASLLHDIGKPRTKRGEGENATFHGHEVVGARMTKEIMRRLKFSHLMTERVRHLVRYHMFYYNVDEVSEAGVRRFIARVGEENIDDILKVREADRIGSKVPKAFPYKLRHLVFMIEKVRHDPVHPKMLTLKGDDVMKILNVPAGPKIGQLLFILLEEVLDDPERNTKEYLEKRVKQLGKCTDEELHALTKKAKERSRAAEEEIEGEMKRRHRVS